MDVSEGYTRIPHNVLTVSHTCHVIPVARFDFVIRVTAPAREGRKEGAKHIKT